EAQRAAVKRDGHRGDRAWNRTQSAARVDAIGAVDRVAGRAGVDQRTAVGIQVVRRAGVAHRAAQVQGAGSSLAEGRTADVAGEGEGAGSVAHAERASARDGGDAAAAGLTGA